VHPSIWVTHDSIEQEIVERGGHSTPSGPTIVAHIGEVGPNPQYPDLIVDSEATAREVLDYIVDRLERGGIPWMNEMATMEGLAAGLERYDQMEPMFPRPIAYREIGRPDLAIASIDRTLAEFAGLPDGGTVGRFRRFARSLRPELEAMHITKSTLPGTPLTG
jgi:hypothetical protein